MEDRILGFGCMRLPMNGDEVDYEEFNKMIDLYMKEGFTYFDTAHGYINGKSEIAIGDCLASRYKREDYILTNKLTKPYFNTKEEIRPFFEKQLETCKVDYFDYYLMHAQDRDNYEHFQKCEAYEVAQELKKEGKVKHVGLSFHDSAEILDKILTDHPEVEVVQIQFNYIDFYNPNVQSKKVYEVCRKHNKPVIVMEPVRGGSLVKIPEDAKKVFDSLGDNMSYASYAIRFAASFEGMFKVLSGMSNLEQMQDNISYMKDFKPLDEREFKAIDEVRDILNKQNSIRCTACRYCEAGCPMRIPIPDLFASYNQKMTYDDWKMKFYYRTLTENTGKASDCIKCGQCENICPQHLPIRELLEKVANEFE